MSVCILYTKYCAIILYLYGFLSLRFIPQYEQLLENCVHVTEEQDGTLTLTNEDAEFILINQDEKSHKSNERPVRYN